MGEQTIACHAGEEGSCSGLRVVYDVELQRLNRLNCGVERHEIQMPVYYVSCAEGDEVVGVLR